jgi:hypothetical protein|tara:strand:- start:17978 stop:18235 length:258 start_codon:yes stop_codon:yes gene_type:complete
MNRIQDRYIIEPGAITSWELLKIEQLDENIYIRLERDDPYYYAVFLNENGEPFLSEACIRDWQTWLDEVRIDEKFINYLNRKRVE